MPHTRSLWRATLADPVTLATLLYALVAIGAAIAAYLAIFTQFAPYDDEGTLLVTLKAFVHGGILYRNIYSEYGPFYYELFGGLFGLTGHAVTTDASRSIVIVVWVATSFLFGLAAQRLTGRLMLGVTGMIVAFGSLYVLIGEPMHPQGLCVLLLGFFTLLSVVGPGRRVVWLGGACGALLAALVLTKVNLGVFAVAAVALAAVLTCEPLYRRRWLRWSVIAAFLAMPIFVMARDLREGWVHDLALLEILATMAIIVAAWPYRPKRGDGSVVLLRWLLAVAVGFALVFVATIGVILLTGPTLSDVYDGVVLQAIRVRDVLVTPLPFPPAVVDWGVAAVATAALATRLRSNDAGGPTIWPGILRVGAGLAIWYSVARQAPFALSPSSGNPDTLPLVLAWVAIISPAGVSESSYKRFLRVMLTALAAAETLQVYPVAGSQMGIASLTFVPIGALCLSDALTSLRAWSVARGTQALERFSVVVAVLTVALATDFALDSIVRPAATSAVAYNDQPALPFPGTTFLHLPPPDVETYTRIVNLLHSNRCTTFAGYPNIDSFYLWSEIEAPPPAAPGAWINAVESKQQRQTVDAMRASPRPCAFRSDARAELWLRGAPPPNRPLVRYLLDDFRPVAKVGEFEFMLPKATITKP